MHSFNMSSAAQGQKTINIEFFLLQQTGTYQDQYLRPFDINVTKDNINQLIRATQEGNNLGIAAVQNVASDIIAPAAQVEGKVNISGENWGGRRFRFVMKVTERNPFMGGLVTQRLIFGSTNSCQTSHGGLIDPNTQVYFNSETVINETIQNSLHGVNRQAVIAGSNQIVSPVDLHATPNPMFASPHAHLCRPEDMFALQQTVSTAKKIELSGLLDDGRIDKVIDQRTMVGEGGAFKYSHRRDTAPTRFVSDTLGAYSHAVREAALSDQDDNDYLSAGSAMEEGQLLGEAYNRVVNQDIQKNGFLAILKDQAHYMERGFVTIADLRRLFPELNDTRVMRHSLDNAMAKRQTNFAEHSNHMHGADPASISSSLLGQVIPSIMMDTFLRQVKITMTNGVGPYNYSIFVDPNGSRSMLDHVDMKPHVLELERRLATDALNSITRGNQIPFRIVMSADLSGDTVVDIALNGETQMTRFIIPTFADSLFSPVITRDEQRPMNMSNNLLYLVKEVIPTPQQQNAGQFVPTYQHPVAQSVDLAQGGSNAISYSNYL